MKKNPWVVLLTVYFAGVSIAMNQFKVPPVLPILMEHFHLSYVVAGWTMSIFDLTSILLGFPAAIMLTKLGQRKAGLIALVLTAIGAFSGYFAPNVQFLMVTRCIEGLGLGTISVIGPAIIAIWFPKEKRGRALGVWTTWVPVGIAVSFNTSHIIESAFGWRAIWLSCGTLVVIALVLYSIFIPKEAPGFESRDTYATHPPMIQGIKGSSIWLLAASFMLFNLAQNGYFNFSPTYLIQELHIQPGLANFDASLISLMGIPTGLISGWMIDKVRRNKLTLSITILLLILCYLFAFRLTTSNAAVYMVIMGIVSGFVPCHIFAMAPEIVSDPSLTGMAMGAVAFCQNLGFLIGPPLMGATIQYSTWQSGSMLMVGAGVMALILTMLITSHRLFSVNKSSSLTNVEIASKIVNK